MIKKVLYVDDERPNRITFQITYRGELEVLLATSADEAMDVLKHQKDIAVVITDMRMPGKTGLDFIREASLLFPKITFCLLTGFEVTPEIQESLDQGILRHYFRKPFDRELILDFIKSKQ